MSTENKVPRTAQTGLAKTKFNLDKVGGIKKPVINKIDVSSLQIDESYDDDCDPYNSTGQFLADAVKMKNDD
jgi:hypothetical protein